MLTGRLEHEELAELLPACEALVVPSTFPEAFGMVAAEAAACGALPVSAAHSGLAEVSEVLARAVPDAGRRVALVPGRRRRRAGARRARSCGWLAADPAAARADPRGARRDGARALVVGGRRARRDRRRAAANLDGLRGAVSAGSAVPATSCRAHPPLRIVFRRS